MSSKGSTGAKGKGAKAGAKKDQAEDFGAEDKLREAEARIQALERALVARTESVARMEGELRALEEQVRQQAELAERERADRQDIVSDMTRQFKAMQDELLRDISDRERGIETVRAQAAKDRIQLEGQLREKDEIIDKKDAEILNLKTRLDQLSREFSAILRETLDTISEKIEHKTDELNAE